MVDQWRGGAEVADKCMDRCSFHKSQTATMASVSLPAASGTRDAALAIPQKSWIANSTAAEIQTAGCLVHRRPPSVSGSACEGGSSMTKPSSARAGNFTSVLQEFGSDTCLSGQTPPTVGMAWLAFARKHRGRPLLRLVGPQAGGIRGIVIRTYCVMQPGLVETAGLDAASIARCSSTAPTSMAAAGLTGKQVSYRFGVRDR